MVRITNPNRFTELRIERMKKVITIFFLTAYCYCLLPLSSEAQDLYSLMENFLKKSQEAKEYSWMQVSRTFEKGKKEALTTETCWFHKKDKGSYLRCDGEGIGVEMLSGGDLFLQVDRDNQTISLAKINGDSVWLNTQNSFLKFKEIAYKVKSVNNEIIRINEKIEERIFTILPKKEYQAMYDSIVYRWENEHLKKMEIYPAKQYQALIASNDDYSENAAETKSAYLDIHWEIVYEQMDSLTFKISSVADYVIKKPDGTFELTEKYKNYSLYY